jgi:hypothetical protein
MTKITKSALAAELGISRARISQYSNMGMPIRSDGLLDREQCLDWIKRNVDPTTSSKGLFAADKAQTRNRRDDGDNPVDLALNAAVGSMFAIMPGIAAAAARHAGVGDEQIEKIWTIAHAMAMRQGDAVATQMLGLEPRGDTWPDIELCRKFTIGEKE